MIGPEILGLYLVSGRKAEKDVIQKLDLTA